MIEFNLEAKQEQEERRKLRKEKWQEEARKFVFSNTYLVTPKSLDDWMMQVAQSSDSIN